MSDQQKPEEPKGSTGDTAQSAEASSAADTLSYYDDPYGYENRDYGEGTSASVPAVVETKPAAPPAPPEPPKSEDLEEEDDDEEGMLRMSFLEHLEELRSRIIKVLAGFGVAFVASLTFTEQLWRAVAEPASSALTSLGLPPNLVAIEPLEQFNIIWLKLPVLTSIFLASPWILYQVWAFVAPGLYKRERKWAAPFVIFSAGLFIAGGLFAYFVAFRLGLRFLLGIGTGMGVTPMISISYYFDLFVNVILGVALVFELPVLIFFLTLLRITTPKFLLANSRYAILIIVALAAILTPTPDIFNLTIFAAPMVVLYFGGVFASYLLVLNREQRRFPWQGVLVIVLIVLLLLAAGVYIAVSKYGYTLTASFPFLTR
ncbi:MAG: twin-arginine translocase subunit TatC [Bryobacteraceae bacterium]|nr:twin-arginine translocase subunit TatC [Bryobacteraceae bacterium]